MTGRHRSSFLLEIRRASGRRRAPSIFWPKSFPIFYGRGDLRPASLSHQWEQGHHPSSRFLTGEIATTLRLMLSFVVRPVNFGLHYSGDALDDIEISHCHTNAW